MFCAEAHASPWWNGVEQYRDDIVGQSIQQMTMVGIAALLAIAVAVPVGIYLSRPSRQHRALAVMQLLNIGQAVPKLALLALAMSVLGIGMAPSIFGLWVATLLPIAVNTFEGLRAVPRPLIEAAIGMGMTPAQILLRVELPNALYVIFAGIRTALAITVGTAPLAFLVGGGGLGELIFTGIDLNDFSMLLQGPFPPHCLHSHGYPVGRCSKNRCVPWSASRFPASAQTTLRAIVETGLTGLLACAFR